MLRADLFAPLGSSHPGGKLAVCSRYLSIELCPESGEDELLTQPEVPAMGDRTVFRASTETG